MDSELISEFDATVKLIKKLRRELNRSFTVEGQRSAIAKNPVADILAQQQTNLRGLARILTVRRQEVPIGDDELSELLD